ncbi:MAG: MFS transporter [Eggerthellaceae bacterium]|nr:MFS transporter [Eggerthellaceae bacterium]
MRFIMGQGTFWTKDFICCALICFLINLGMYVTMVVVVSYASGPLAAGAGLAGLASGAFIVGALLGRLVIGEGVERIGLKKVLMAGLVVFLAGIVLNLAFAGFAVLVAARIIQGLGYGFATTSLGTIVAQIIPAARKGEGMSYYTMFLTLSTAVGPFIANALYDDSMLGVLLTALAALALSVALGIAVKVPALPEAPAGQAQAEQRHGLARFFERKAVPIGVVTFFMALSFASIMNFGTAYAAELSYSVYASFLFVAYALFTIISRLFTGKLFDRFGPNCVLYPSFILFALALALMAWAPSGVALLGAGALMGLGYGTYMSLSQTIAIQVSPVNHTGLATSTFFILMDLGTGFGPSLLGSVVGVVGYSDMYWIMTVVPLASILFYYLAHGRKAAVQSRSGSQLVSSRPAKQDR